MQLFFRLNFKKVISRYCFVGFLFVLFCFVFLFVCFFFFFFVFGLFLFFVVVFCCCFLFSLLLSFCCCCCFFVFFRFFFLAYYQVWWFPGLGKWPVDQWLYSPFEWGVLSLIKLLNYDKKAQKLIWTTQCTLKIGKSYMKYATWLSYEYLAYSPTRSSVTL